MYRLYRYFCLYLLLCLAVPAAAQTNAGVLFNELYASYKGGFYPGTAERAREFQKYFPYSSRIPEVCLYEGESLFRLGYLVEAEDPLLKALKEGSDRIRASAAYWLGRCAYEQRQFDICIERLYKSCKLYRNMDKSHWNSEYWSALWYSALACVQLSQPRFEDAVLLASYVKDNGLWQSDEQRLQIYDLLLSSYAALDEYEQVWQLYMNMPIKELVADEKVYSRWMMTAAGAAEKTDRMNDAFTLYTRIVSEGYPDTVAALKKLYLIAVSDPEHFSLDTVLESVDQSQNDLSVLLSYMWLYLAEDAFTAGRYEQSMKYAEKARHSGNAETQFLSTLYYAESVFRSAHGSETARAVSAAAELSAAAEFAMEGENRLLYQGQMIRYAAFSENWLLCLEHGMAFLTCADPAQAGLPTGMYEDAVYYTALAYANMGDIQEGLAVIEQYGMTDDMRLNILAAHLFAGDNRYEQSAARYAFADEYLNAEECLEYAKVLLRLGRNADAFEYAVRAADTSGAEYTAALAAFNMKNWQCAAELFLRSRKMEDEQYVPYAQFYYGYSCYRLGQNKSAWTELISFTEAYPQHVLAPPAFRMAVSAAVLLSGEDTENRGLWLERAEQSAAELIKLSNTFSDKRDACLLAASVSRDRGEYVKALAYIEPVTDFDQDSVPIIYFKALIYSDMERLTEADKTFKFIEETFPSSGYADEAAFRRGEIFYTAGDYESAAERFTVYRRQRPQGKYIDAAVYFGAESFMQIGHSDLAILLYQMLWDSYPESTYLYDTLIRLVDLYTGTGEYQRALDCISALQSSFPQQVKGLSLNMRRLELEKLNAGADEAVVSAQAEYERLGGSLTEQGRTAGIRLAGLLLDRDGIKAEQLLQELLNAASKQSDTVHEAEAIMLLALWYRSTEQYSEASSNYLIAAEKFVLFDRERAAQCLYSAAESFDLAGMDANVHQIITTLRNSFSDTIWASRAAVLSDQF